MKMLEIYPRLPAAETVVAVPQVVEEGRDVRAGVLR